MFIIVCAIAVIMTCIAATLDSKLARSRQDTEEAIYGWNKSIDRYQARIEEKTDKIEELEREVSQLKEKNVSRGTSYNPSYGLPEVVDWIDQHQPTGEEIKHG